MIRKFSTTFPLLALSVGASFVASGLAQAANGGQLEKLLPSDADPYDFFGSSVSVSGTTAIIGAMGDDDLGDSAGSAYLFDTVSCSQIAKLLPSDGQESDAFGISVSISGTTAIVGAPYDDDLGEDSGAAYLFDTVTGLQTAKLLASDGGAKDWFGESVSISGTTAIVGARQYDGTGTDSGAAYLFDTVTGLQIAKLLGNDLVSYDNFGASVSISGTTAIVGSTGDDDMAVYAGSAYLFDTVTGLQTAKLLPDLAQFGLFGYSVAVGGTTAIVGAPSGDGFGNYAGSAYLFDTVTGLRIAKLLPSDGHSADHFGHSVSISGKTAIVGAEGNIDHGTKAGSSYLFDAVTGVQTARLIPNDVKSFDNFGKSVSVAGYTILVGAWRDDDNGSSSGGVYKFQGPPDITSDVPSTSLSTGGSQLLSLEGGTARAGWVYLTLGSVTGTEPGINLNSIKGGEFLLPLNFDAYMRLTLLHPGLGVFGNFLGVLDGAGQAVASFTLPSSMDPSLAGVMIHHAFLTGEVFGEPLTASNAVSLLLVP